MFNLSDFFIFGTSKDKVFDIKNIFRPSFYYNIQNFLEEYYHRYINFKENYGSYADKIFYLDNKDGCDIFTHYLFKLIEK